MKIQDGKPECRRCGRCCHYIDENGTVRKCGWLIELGYRKDGNPFALCRNYSQRLQHRIYKDYFCTRRENVKSNFKGCPYNRLEWE
jgi:hypothetical protein